jgi:hypothetical protein
MFSHRAALVGVLAITVAVVTLHSLHGSNTCSRITLWAWDVPEDLRFLDQTRFSVAYLTMSVDAAHGRVTTIGRHNPILIAPGVTTIPVVRIDCPDSTLVDLNSLQVEACAAQIASLADPTTGLQIDFDARRSERAFYSKLLAAVRRRIGNRPLVITALGSWCIYDRWIDALPIDEAIPMLFRMGPEDRWIREYLGSGNGLQSKFAQDCNGISVDEPVPSIDLQKPIYVFNPRSWTPNSIQRLLQRTALRTDG